MEVTLVLVLLAGFSSSSLCLPPALDITRLEPRDARCRADLAALAHGLDTGQLWAQTMWDAGVKSPVGLLSQTAVQFGDFDECLTISSPVTSQFCLVDISPTKGDNTSWTSFKLGICIPASCSAQELRTSLQVYMDGETTPGEEVQVGVIPQACTTKDTTSRKLTLTDLIYSVVVVGMVLMVIVATVYEMILRPQYDGVSPPETVIQCLSARHGFYSLLRVDQPVPGVNLRTLYGLHFVAIYFVVLGHRFGTHFFFMTLTNYRSVVHMFADSWFSIWAGHMDMFVDMFFFMSAFLLALLYYAELHKQFVSPLKVYFHRICRIIPVYAVIVFFYATLLRQLGDGPLWNMFMDEEQFNCRYYWWANLLFLNNYVGSEHMCQPQSWYVTCDFQLFLVGTLLVLMLQRTPQPGVVMLLVLFLASTLAPFLGTYFYDRPAFMLFHKDFWTNPRHHDMFNSIYSQGHYRGTSYLPGLLAGCYVYRHRLQHLSKAWTNSLQACGFVICLLVYWSGALFHDETRSLGHLVTALYAATHHTAFGLGLALLMVSFTLGQPTILSHLLSWSGFVPVSKLSYCVYVVHLIPQVIWVASSRTPVYLNPLELVSWSIADLAISLMIALVLFLTVETPVRYLIKYFVTGARLSVTPSQTQKQTETT